MTDQNKLYALARGEGRCNAETLCRAANELGISCFLRRQDAGYSTRMGQQGKLPDRIWIEYGGENYGAGLVSRLGESMGLQQFAEVVLDTISNEQRRVLEIEYHIQHLIRLGVKVDARY